jgi:outer membrane murein-binding lipoprotein Lpp
VQEAYVTHRWLLATVLVTGLLLSGCSSTSKTTNGSGSSTKGSSSTAAAPVTTLDSGQCVDLTGANADLSTATDKDVARKAADTLERYSPPSDVKDAIEHFVGTGGAQFDDPDYMKYNKTLSGWVKGVCPS